MDILIVDDSSFMRTQLRAQLESAGYCVHEAESGSVALDLIKSKPFSLVTLDIEMPQMSGYEVCAALRDENNAQLSTLPVVFVTSKDSLAERIKGFESGGTEFITKSNLKENLLLVVDQIVRPERQFTGMRALVVDDSRVVRKIVHSSLQQMGVETLESENGRQALEIMKSNPRLFDLVLMDQEMPEMNGTQACHHLRKALGMREIPVIFLVGTAEKDDVVSIFESGATDYLRKPFLKEEFFGRIKPHLSSRQLSKKMLQV